MQKELNHKLRTARRKERETLESHCSGMNTKKLWDSMKTMTNMTPAKRCMNVLYEKEKAYELNNFFCQFDSRDFSHEKKTAMDGVPESGPGVIIDQHTVARLFSYICPRKGSGPDGISGHLLWSCRKELAEAWCPIFQKSLDTHSVPST